MSPSVESITGYAVSTQSVSSCVADVVAWIERAQPAQLGRWLACLNPHSYAMALDDPPFAQALHAADWLIPDGAGIVLASKLLGGRIRERRYARRGNPPACWSGWARARGRRSKRGTPKTPITRGS